MSQQYCDTTDLELENYAVIAQSYDGNEDILVEYDPEDVTIDLADNEADGNEVKASVSIDIDSPELWFPDTPNLYTLVLTLYDKSTGTAIEHISQQLGFREITFLEEDGTTALIRINGKKLMMYGVNRVETSPDGGHYVSPELCEQEVQIMKQNNINTIRTSHCPPDTYLCYLADKYGLMLIYEANNESHAERNSSISDDNFYDLALSRVFNAVEWEKNRTSNIMWSLGNESGKQENWLKVIAQLRKVDATRPVHYEGITGNNRSGSMNPKWKPATEDEVYPDVQSSMYSFPKLQYQIEHQM